MVFNPENLTQTLSKDKENEEKENKEKMTMARNAMLATLGAAVWLEMAEASEGDKEIIQKKKWLRIAAEKAVDHYGEIGGLEDVRLKGDWDKIFKN